MEQKIILLIKESLEEVEKSSDLSLTKKKYLGKQGLIFQFLQQLIQEKDLEKKKRLGFLINN